MNLHENIANTLNYHSCMHSSNPADTWEPTAPMAQIRGDSGWLALDDNRLLIAGGYNKGTKYDTMEIWDAEEGASTMLEQTLPEVTLSHATL